LQILMATLLAFAMIYAIHKVFALTNAKIGNIQNALR
jgi:hypothetical protein